MLRECRPTLDGQNGLGLLTILSFALGACSGSSPSNAESGVGGSTVGGAVREIGGGTAGGAAGMSSAMGGSSNGGTISLGGGSTKGGTPSTGGAVSGGGSTSIGGGIGNGGTPTSGGSSAKGGTPGTGGAVFGGGSTSIGGGIGSGGTPTLGGSSAKGGSTGSGGAVSTGGSTSVSGGTTTGGTSTLGGSSAKGGTTGSGGTGLTGGNSAVGGAPSTGGVSATGGASSSACPGETSGVTASKTIYVSPTGVSTNSGSTSSAPKDLVSAINAVQPGEMLLLAPGTYAIAYTANAKNTIVLSKAGTNASPIKIVAANCGRAVIDFSFPEQAWVQDSYGFSLTGSYYYFKGLDITRAGYQGVYVVGQYNTFENCSFHDNRNTGLEINEGGAYTTVINSDAYRNYDPKKFGSMADGFGPKQTQGPGNKFIGCRVWENSDDGFDAYDSPEIVTFENCWAFRNGVDVWNYGSFAGNGNGFKAGGNAKLANHKLTQCVAFGNPTKGFDQNNNAGGITLFNCTGYQNGTNFGLGGALASGQAHVLKNNISLGGGANSFTAGATQQNNSWSSGFSVAASDFVSLDLSQATAARNPDGSLPKTTLFRLASSSKLVDAGVDVGLSFSGSAPDLGAFELGQ